MLRESAQIERFSPLKRTREKQILSGVLSAFQLILGSEDTAQSLPDAVSILGNSLRLDQFLLFKFNTNSCENLNVSLILISSWYKEKSFTNFEFNSKCYYNQNIESILPELRSGKIILENSEILDKNKIDFWGLNINQSVAICPILFKEELKGIAILCSNNILHIQSLSVQPLVSNITNIFGGAFFKVDLENKLRHQALHDPLTKLPNRLLFLNRLEHIINQSSRDESYCFTVLYLDLDRFKIINDSLGHAIGDQLLILISQRLKASIRPGDTVARLGGDEFAILLEDLSEKSHILDIVQRIFHELSSPFIICGNEILSGASIGIAIGDKRYLKPDEIIHDADIAMYQAKKSAQSYYAFYQPKFQKHANYLLLLNNEIFRSIENNQLQTYYQPIHSMNTSKIAGFEALSRWHHPEMGWIRPDEFISIAEQNDFIFILGEFVLKNACSYLNNIIQKFDLSKEFYITVNISAKQIYQPNFLEIVNKILSAYNLSPNQIKFEITESFLIENINTVISNLNALRDLGLELLIDDFGAGYSSLRYLQYLPVNALKIDREIVQSIDGDSDNLEVLKSIISLSHNLGLKVIAEGIETKKQFEVLKALKCEYGQGYLFSKPVDMVSADKYLNNNFL